MPVKYYKIDPKDRHTVYLSDKIWDALSELARRLGYITKRGRNAGKGDVSQMVLAMAHGDLTPFTYDKETGQLRGISLNNKTIVIEVK